ncbi:hypothetical protein GOODEAATRI_019960 [Goodea atripinnis]|uniref:SH3 domain-containing protein n=1 Tax=Goodea atripinnis TaxID=208336 RepID=A0ABV0PQ29_9TELE
MSCTGALINYFHLYSNFIVKAPLLQCTISHLVLIVDSVNFNAVCFWLLGNGWRTDNQTDGYRALAVSKKDRCPATPLTPSPGLPSSLSSSSLTPILPPTSPRPAENSPTTLCSFFPSMRSIRLGVSATLLPGPRTVSRSQPAQAPVESSGDARSNSSSSPPLHQHVALLTAPCPPPRPPLQDMNRLGGASRRARVEGGQLGGDEWTRHGSFVNKPTRGWLHSDNVVSTTGVSYTVRVS